MSVTIALADSSPLILASLSEVFEKDDRFSLVSTANTAEALIGTVIRVPVDICVISWGLPIMGGKRLTETLRDLEKAPRIVIYGAQSDTVIHQALISGAAGFCSSDNSANELLDICSDIANGKMVFPFLDVRSIEANPLTRLTRRESKLLEALASGLTNKQIATHFEISPNTVKFHLSNIYDKIEAKNRTQAVAIFARFSHEFQ